MKKFFRPLVALSLALYVVIGIASPLPTLAATSKTQACYALEQAGPVGSCSGDGSNAISGILRTVIRIITTIAGVIAVIMLIVGGLKYITSGGDSNAAASAKNTIIYSIVGIVIVVFAQLIVKFVLSKAK